MLYCERHAPLNCTQGARETEARIRRRNGSCHFDPPASFVADVVRHHGARPERECRARAPVDPVFHATMDDDTLQSYLTWRAGVLDRTGAEPV